MRCGYALMPSPFFFFNDTATTETSPLPPPAALPISRRVSVIRRGARVRTAAPLRPLVPRPLRRTRRQSTTLERQYPLGRAVSGTVAQASWIGDERSEEHTSELQSQSNLVCRLLLEKK